MNQSQTIYEVRLHWFVGVCLFLWWGGSCVFAQKVTASIDRDTIKIGEQINYKIEVETEPSARVVFPQGQSFLPLEIIDSTAVDTFKTKDAFKLQKVFPLTQFDSGAYTVPKQTIIINDQGYYTDSFAVTVNAVAVDTTKQKLYPIKPALDVRLPFGLPRWMGWVLGFLALAFLVYVFLKSRKRIIEKRKELPPFEKAIQSLKKLDERRDLEEGKIKHFYSSLSETLKRYVDEKMDDRAMESTTDEFIVLLRLFKKEKQLYLKEQVIDSIEAFMRRSDLTKFAGVRTDKLTAKEDRELVEENIKAFNQVIPEPTEEEKLKDEAYRRAVERKQKLRRRSFQIGGALAVLVIGFFVFLGIKGADYTKSLFSSHYTEKLLKSDWIKSEYGTLGMTVSTPEVLLRHMDTTDLVLPGKAQSEERFSFGNIRGRFYVQITNVRVKSTAQVDSLDPGKLLDTELAFAKVDNVTFKNEEFKTPHDEKGQRIFGTFTLEDPLARSSRRKQYTFLIFLERGGLQELLITHDQNDEAAQELVERITNSVEFEKEYDG